MEVKKIDSRTYVVFSADEIKARIEFEQAMSSEDVLNKLIESLVRAITNLEQDKRTGWNQLTGEVVKLLNLKNRDDLPSVLSYSWLYGGIEIPEDLISPELDT